MSQSNKNQAKSLLVYLWFPMIHALASAHLLIMSLRTDIAHVRYSFTLLSTSLPFAVPSGLWAVHPLPQLSSPPCAAGTLLLPLASFWWAREGPGPLWIQSRRGRTLFQINLKIASQKALQLGEWGVDLFQLNHRPSKASQAQGRCLVSSQTDAEMDEGGTAAVPALRHPLSPHSPVSPELFSILCGPHTPNTSGPAVGWQDTGWPGRSDLAHHWCHDLCQPVPEAGRSQG